MEKVDHIRKLENKQNAEKSNDSVAQEQAVSSAEFEKMKELNQKMTTGMQEMQQALMDTRKEKNGIISKSEQDRLQSNFVLNHF